MNSGLTSPQHNTEQASLPAAPRKPLDQDMNADIDEKQRTGGWKQLDSQRQYKNPTQRESNDQGGRQDQVDPEDFPTGMMYCAPTMAPPPPSITQLSKITKVAAPLTQEQLQSIPKKHDIVCKCGCIPAIPSMFQMAELRKQAREKAKREQESKKE